MLSCKQATRLASQALDRPLSLRERLGLRAHLMICAGCAQFERQLGFLREASKRFAEGTSGGAEDTDDIDHAGSGGDGAKGRDHRPH